MGMLSVPLELGCKNVSVGAEMQGVKAHILGMRTCMLQCLGTCIGMYRCIRVCISLRVCVCVHAHEHMGTEGGL